MSDHPEHYREIAKALRDGLARDDKDYKDLCLGIILNHMYLISRNNAQFYDATEDLLEHLMIEHDPDTYNLWMDEAEPCPILEKALSEREIQQAAMKAEYEAKKEALMKEMEELKKKIRLGCGCAPYQPCHTCGKYM
jgi:hypothetical protein